MYFITFLELPVSGVSWNTREMIDSEVSEPFWRYYSICPTGPNARLGRLRMGVWWYGWNTVFQVI